MAESLDPKAAAHLAKLYDKPWRDEGGIEILENAGVYGVWTDGRTGRAKEWFWVRGPLSNKQFGSRDIDTIELADEMIRFRPALRVLLRGHAHDYYFYVNAGTVQEAIDQFEVSEVMAS